MVWRARHRAGYLAALKVLSGGETVSDAYLRWFRHEVRTVARLDHPGIVAIYDYGHSSEAGAWLAMELVAGGSLDELPRPVDWPTLRPLLEQLLKALAYAHARGTIHRDLKPANVLRDAQGRVRLTDFGLAHAFQDASPFREKRRLAGTPNYMAPEQIRAQWRGFGPWTDLYGLGCLAWTLATGTAPFETQNIHETLSGHLVRPVPPLPAELALPSGAEAWLARLLAKAPEDRYRRAADALADLPEGPAAPQAAAKGERSSGSVRLWGLRQPPLVGRATERAALQQALDDVCTRQSPRVILLRGPSGVGKTRLAQWLCERAHETGSAMVMEARHDQALGPEHGLGAMVRRFLRLDGLSGVELLERMESELRALGAETPDEWSALVGLVQPDDPLAPRLAGPGERHAVLRRLLRRLTGRRAVVCALDDAQWGPDGVRFAERLLDDRHSGPILLVLSVQEEALAGAPAADNLESLASRSECVTLRIPPIPEAERVALVQGLMPLTPELAQEVVLRTEGNPLFAIELVGDWVERGALNPGVGGLELPAELMAALPDGVQHVWRDRVERLLKGRPESVSIALELAAILGRGADRDDWTAACAQVAVAADPALVEALVERRLVTPSERGAQFGWTFVHGLLQAAIVTRAQKAGRLARLHRACAAALDRRGGLTSSERVGKHLLEAGDDREALAPLLEAARRRLRSEGGRGVAPLLDQRLEAMDRLAIAAGDRLRGLGRRIRSEAARRAGRIDLSEPVSVALEADARTYGWPHLLAEGLIERGTVLRLQGTDPAAARVKLEEAIALALDSGNREQLG
ncbi:MAG: hypothetical protein ACI9WU_002393, partial [Myxococcota bacterium]